MTGPIDILERHSVFMTDEDELESSYDPDLLPHRTCRCGSKIVGFDEYTEHLKDRFEKETE